MPIHIQAPDGTIVEFPDGTPDNVIEGAMRQEFGGPQDNVPVSGDGSSFDQFKQRLNEGKLSGINSGSAMSDMGAQTQKGLVQGLAGMAQMPEAIGGWLGDLPFRAYDAAMGREHHPAPRVQGLLPTPGEVGQMAVDATGVGEPKTAAGGYANTVAQFLPGVLVGGPANMADKVTRAITGGVGSEAAGSATKGTAAEPYARLVGGLLGGFAPDVARRVATPLPIPEQRKTLLGPLDAEGVDMTAGQRTGNKPLQYLEAELGGAKAADVMDRQSRQFTAAAARKAGVNADNLTPDVMNKAFEDIGTRFDNLASKTAVPMDTQMQDDLLNAVIDYQAVDAMPAPAAESIMNRISSLASKNGSVLDGKAYKEISSDIARYTRTAKDPALISAMRTMKSALDDAIERGLSGDLLNEWRAARNQYKNLLVLEKGVSGAGAEDGLISPAKLRSAAVQKEGRNFVRGRSDFTDLAKAGEAGLKPLPNSGTAGRLKAQNLGAGLTTLLGSVAGSGGGIPGMLLGGMAGLGTPYAAGRILMSRPIQAYLGNQAFRPNGASIGQRAIVPLLGSSSAIAKP